jgi:hypothetical protein
MTFTTGKHVIVDRMLEDNLAETCKNDIASMTSGAVFTHTESGIAVVAGTTGRTGFHPLHTNLIAVGLGFECVGVAFVAVKHLCMNGMAERNLADVLGLNSHINSVDVTSGAVFTHTESGIAVVAGTTGRTTLHLLHTNLVTIGFRLEYVRVAFVATERFCVSIVTKDNLSHSTLYADLRRTQVTAATVAFDTKSRIAIMACPARFTSLHLLHTNLVTVGYCLK